MKNVIGSLLALVAVVSLAISLPVSANPGDHAKPGDAKKGEVKKKEPPKPKGPTTGSAGTPGDKPATPEG
jgi:hypothetical protein